MSASRLCIDGLILIAAVVTWKQWRKQNAWPWVVAYWLVLTMKNLFDRLGL